MTTPSEWPFPAERENQLARARRVAHMYRAALGLQNPELREQIDNTALGYGELWVTEGTYSDSDELTTEEAALFVSVKPSTIRKWAATHHPTIPNRRVLPKYGTRNRMSTYLAGNVKEAAAIMSRYTQLARRQHHTA